MAQLVLQVQLESLGRLASLAQTVLLEQQVQPEPQVLLELPGLMAQLVLQALQALTVLLEQQV